MKTRTTILLLVGGLAALATTFVLVTRKPAVTDRPNILLIVSDDQGYADAGFMGSKEILTPNLDELAASGTRFTNAYASHPFCSPTRAGLLTGRYQQRFGHEGNPLYDPAYHQGLPLTEKLLPEYLAAAGYTTAWIGKWHLGTAPEFAPGKRGFQETFGVSGGSHFYLDWKVDNNIDNSSYIERNGAPIDVPQEHLTTVFGHEAAAFVRRQPQGKPWFLYFALTAPHVPHQPTVERRKRFADIPDLKRRLYAAQISLMDDAIGETIDALRESGQYENTLVIFLGDNGGATKAAASNGSLRNGKGSVYEGGVRVPYVVSWPAQLDSGETDKRMVSSLDVFATALAVANVPMPTDKKYDSINLIPFLSGENSGELHPQLFWRSGNLGAMREGDWKLVHKVGRPPQLYNLDSDIGENNNRAQEKPELVIHLDTLLSNWNSELIDPVFVGLNLDRNGKEIKTDEEK